MTLAPVRELDIDIGPLTLENGSELPRVVQRVTQYGAPPRPDGRNVVYVAHALTGSGRILDWWSGYVGPGKALDTDRLTILGTNVLGSCYGSTGPASLAGDGKPYGSRFPVVTVGDMVRAQARAVTALGFTQMAAVVGGSLGAMQALQWMLLEPERFTHGLLYGAYDSFSAMAIALNALSRAAILHDPAFAGGDYYETAPPHDGLRLARMIAMVTYKSEALFAERFGRTLDRDGRSPWIDPRARFNIEGYLEYQGEKFIARMDANAYLALTRAMDLYDVRSAATPPSTAAKLTFVGIDSDWLFPAKLIADAAARFTERGYDCTYLELHSTHGHDAFLADLEDLTALTAPRIAPIYEAL